MKRIITVGLLLIVIIGISVYSMHQVREMNDQILVRIDRITDAMEADNRDAMLQEINTFKTWWDNCERSIVHMVRHEQIDNITKSVARLESLARYGDDANLAAELESILWQVRHVLESERPIWENILRTGLLFPHNAAAARCA